MGVIVQIVNDVEIEFQSAYAVFMLICAPYYNFLLLWEIWESENFQYFPMYQCFFIITLALIQCDEKT